MKRGLREVKKKFANPRLTELQAEAQTIEIDVANLIVEEDTYVQRDKRWLHQTYKSAFLQCFYG